MMAVFFFIAHEKRFKFHAQPQTSATHVIEVQRVNRFESSMSHCFSSNPYLNLKILRRIKHKSNTNTTKPFQSI